MQNKPSTASDKKLGKKEKGIHGGRFSRNKKKKKKSNHYYKGLYQELLLPHPVCWKSQEHIALYSCQMSDQSILTQSRKEIKEGGGKGEQRKPPTPLNGSKGTRVQFQKREWQLKEVMMVAIIL